MSKVLAVRLDNVGDVLLTGPAVRALAATASGVDLLVSGSGEAAARLLPGVDEVLRFDAPWSGYRPPEFSTGAVQALLARLRAHQYDRAVVFTSDHQSPLPMALLARMAGIGWVGATSHDYPGALLDVRHPRPEGLHEVEAALGLARAAGGELAPGDDGRLRVREPLPPVADLVPDGPYVVVHPSASVPSRAPAPEHAAAMVAALTDAGWRVLVTGGASEHELAAQVAGSTGTPVAGRTDLHRLAALLAGAACVVTGNTGPAHLAAAVDTPVVSLFSPVVPAERWAPYGVPVRLLGDQGAACRGSRARECPVAGHPCLTGISPAEVVDAVAALVAAAAPHVPGSPSAVLAGASGAAGAAVAGAATGSALGAGVSA
ncbi:glycosyltransferase family 9 protein [Cellulomonas sp. NS3]|uniref:glycosyltransferase family 9 protein n=1 Tax=Cellulomonas sp. NS3 TaxID=2973977 RepID=UPI002161AE38|nr:glycosyltransferase family 9 protein [Cellulomonas sp. NS3]